MDMCIHLKRSMKIKWRRLEDDSCTRDNVAKFGRSGEDLIAMT